MQYIWNYNIYWSTIRNITYTKCITKTKFWDYSIYNIIQPFACGVFYGHGTLLCTGWGPLAYTIMIVLGIELSEISEMEKIHKKSFNVYCSYFYVYVENRNHTTAEIGYSWRCLCDLNNNLSCHKYYIRWIQPKIWFNRINSFGIETRSIEKNFMFMVIYMTGAGRSVIFYVRTSAVLLVSVRKRSLLKDNSDHKFVWRILYVLNNNKKKTTVNIREIIYFFVFHYLNLYTIFFLISAVNEITGKFEKPPV